MTCKMTTSLFAFVMGMNQLPLRTNRNTRTHSVRARIYRFNGARSQPVQACYQEETSALGKRRYVFATETLSYPKMQRYVHDSIVDVVYYGRLYTFRVFYRRHKRLPTNQRILQLTGIEMDGDVLVVAYGTRFGVRNFRGNVEAQAADEAVRKLARALTPFRTKRKFPSHIP
ncbi:hypothetical protein EV360DRAFT_74277 [Lentinula raphanica]|nr:hypothetical protein EV360DRAFT_74277 [Lentinula raphanica]